MTPALRSEGSRRVAARIRGASARLGSPRWSARDSVLAHLGASVVWGDILREVLAEPIDEA